MKTPRYLQLIVMLLVITNWSFETAAAAPFAQPKEWTPCGSSKQVSLWLNAVHDLQAKGWQINGVEGEVIRLAEYGPGREHTLATLQIVHEFGGGPPLNYDTMEFHLGNAGWKSEPIIESHEQIGRRWSKPDGWQDPCNSGGGSRAVNPVPESSSTLQMLLLLMMVGLAGALLLLRRTIRTTG